MDEDTRAQASARIQQAVQEGLCGPGPAHTLTPMLGVSLALAASLGDLRCVLTDEQRLRFLNHGEIIDDAEIPRIHPWLILRMLCARLAVLCNQHGTKVSPYGGRGFFTSEVAAGERIYFDLEFTNGPERPEFNLKRAHTATPPT